jgi:hypothetical protein
MQVRHENRLEGLLPSRFPCLTRIAGQIIYYLTRGVPSYDFLKLYGTYQNLKIWYFGYHSSSQAAVYCPRWPRSPAAAMAPSYWLCIF